MKTTDFYAVILSGGSGERFWPLSTSDRPKQFLSVFGGKSLIRQAVDRLRGLVPRERILVVTAGALVKATRQELPELPRANVVAEPCRRDTAAAVATACGVAPDYPATGFGYIQVGDPVPLRTKTTFHRAVRFVEKPDEKTAARYLATGRYAWNAGMFVWKVATMKAALVAGAPALAILEAAVADRKNRVPAVLETLYPQLPRISIDYAVMEKAKNILVSRAAFGWDDVGTWSAADRHLATDARRNVVKGDVATLDVSDSVAISEGPHVAVLGVDGLVVVATKDSVLVAAKDRVQDLKKLLAKMSVK